MSQKRNPKIAKDVSQAELSEVAEKVVSIYERLIKQIEPAKKRPSQIQLALLVKMLRMYKNLFRVADYGEGDLTPLIARQIFEFALTLCYLIVNHEEDLDLYNKFARTSFIRLHMVLKTMQDPDDPYKDFKSPSAAKSIIENLQAHGYDPLKEKITNIPNSWHPDKSYAALASDLGKKFESMYKSFYSYTSSSIHPDWLELERNYLMRDSKGKIIANYNTPPAIIFPMVSATCMMLDTAEVCAMNFVKQKIKEDLNLKLDEEIKALHYSLHSNDKPPEDGKYTFI